MVKNILHKKKELSIISLLFLFIFAVYCVTAAQYHTSIADSDEFGILGYLGGIAHPPGYIVYVDILYIFTHLFALGTIYWRESILSGLLDAGSIVFVYLSIKEILGSDKEYFWQKSFFSFLASCMLAFSFLFWLYANMPEVFALNNLFCALLLYLAFRFARFSNTKGTTQKGILLYLCGVSFLLGLALSHLQIIIILYPVFIGYYIYLLKRTRQFGAVLRFKAITAIAASFCIGFGIALMLLLIANAMSHSVSWQVGGGIQGLVAFISRQYYGSGGSAYAANTNIVQDLGSLGGYLRSVSDDFSFFPLLFVFGGAVYLWMKHRSIFVFLSLLYLCGGVLLAMYLGYPKIASYPDEINSFATIAIVQRQYIMGDLLLAPFIACGMYGMSSLITSLLIPQPKGAKGLSNAIQSAIVVGCIAFAMLIFSFLSNYNQLDLHNFTYMESFAHDSLEEASKDAIVFCFTDVTCDGYLYEQQVLGTRPDLLIIPDTYAFRQQYLNSLHNLQGFYYGAEPYTTGDIISWALLHNRAVYVADIDTTDDNYLGDDGGAYFLIPDGYLHKVSRRVTAPLDPTQSFNAVKEYDAFVDSTAGGVNTKNYFYLALYGYITHQLGLDVFDGWNEGQTQYALSLFHTQYRDSQDFMTQDDYSVQEEYYAHEKGSFVIGDSIPSAQTLVDRASHASPQQKILDLRYATFVDPLNAQARIELAQAYGSIGQKGLEVIELNNVLIYDPHNGIAKKMLQ